MVRAYNCQVDPEALAKRTTAEVFMDHLNLRYKGEIECDYKRNYSKDVILVENFGIFHGHEGLKKSFNILNKLVPTTKYHMDSLFFSGDKAFEAWSVNADGVRVADGIDAFIIRDGKIKVQTIYYDSNSKFFKELEK